MPELTEIQKNVCRFIQDHSAQKGFPPTRVEIAENFGWRSPNAAEVHIQALKKKGVVSSIPGYARTLRVLISI